MSKNTKTAPKKTTATTVKKTQASKKPAIKKTTKTVTSTTMTEVTHKGDNSWVFFLMVIVAFFIMGFYLYTAQSAQAPQPPTPIEEVTVMEDPLVLLTQNKWQWQQTIMNDESVVTPNQPEAFVLTFEKEGNVFTTTDCNSGRGGFTVSEDKRLQIGPMATTLMFCIDAQEGVYYADLGRTESFIILDNKLILQLPFDSGVMIFDPITE